MRLLAWCLACSFVACHARDDAPAATPPDQAPREVNETALRALSDGDQSLQRRLAQAKVPVLAPADRTLIDPVLIVREHFVALSGRDQGAFVSIQATRRANARHVEVPPPTQPLRGLHGYVSVNEGVRVASWRENGVAYQVDVECKDLGDPICKDDRYLLQLVEQLAYVGGAGR